MSLPPLLQRLRIPVIGAPMFIAGNPKLVTEQCKAGIVGSFPALNARPKEALDDWLTEIGHTLSGYPDAAPYAVNQIVHKSNDRLEHDLEVCIRHEVPITITSLRAPNDVIPHIHAYGGIVLHDVISVRHAEKALEAGVDGLILVCAGAGGHAGTLSPFALIGEVRRFFDGPIVLSGAIASGNAILAALAAGADLAYIGTRFLATPEYGTAFTNTLKNLSPIKGIKIEDPITQDVAKLAENSMSYLMLVRFRYQEPSGSVLLQSNVQKMLAGQQTPEQAAAEINKGIATYYKPFQK